MQKDWEEDDIVYESLGAMIIRNLIPLAVSLLIGLFAGLAYLVFATPKYTAETTLILETRTGIIGDVETLYLDLDTHAELIGSDGVVAEVIRRLNLVDDPRFDPDTGMVEKIVNFTRARFSRPLLGEVRHLDTAAVSGENAVPSEQEEILARVPGVASKLFVYREGHTRLLFVTYSTSDPELSAQIANTFAEVYTEHLERIGSANAFLQASEEIPVNDEISTAASQSEPLTVNFLSMSERAVATESEAGLFDALRIVSRATVPTANSSPNIHFVLAAFASMGLFIGALIIARREWNEFY